LRGGGGRRGRRRRRRRRRRKRRRKGKRNGFGVVGTVAPFAALKLQVDRGRGVKSRRRWRRRKATGMEGGRKGRRGRNKTSSEGGSVFDKRRGRRVVGWRIMHGRSDPVPSFDSWGRCLGCCGNRTWSGRRRPGGKFHGHI